VSFGSFPDLRSVERVTLPLENLDHEKVEAYNGNQQILMVLEWVEAPTG